MPTPTEINLNNTNPPAPAGTINVAWQASAPYPDPNNPTAPLRDVSANVPIVRGTAWFTGSGAPGTIAGQQNGDFYLNTATGDVWELESGTWTEVGNIEGPAGASGSGTPTGTDLFILGAPDPTNLPDSVAIPGLFYGPDVMPASPTTYDDEFPGSSLAGAWSWLQQGASSAAVGGSCLQLTVDPTSNLLRGIYKAVPGTTPWEFTAKITLDSAYENYVLGGLMLYESATGKQMWFGLAFLAAQGAVVGHGSTGSPVNSYDYSVSGTNYFSQMYVRVRFDGINLIFSWSLTGIAFIQVFSQAVTTRFTTKPDSIGLGLSVYGGSSNPTTLVCDWFRRTA
jgi:hypothetical protein